MTIRERMFTEQDARAVLNQLATGVIQLDASLNILEANSAAESLVAMSVFKLRGMSINRLFPDNENFVQAVREAAANLRSFTERDMPLTRPNRERLHVDCTVSPGPALFGAGQAIGEAPARGDKLAVTHMPRRTPPEGRFQPETRPTRCTSHQPDVERTIHRPWRMQWARGLPVPYTWTEAQATLPTS
jgi:PAS domain-containing protein